MPLCTPGMGVNLWGVSPLYVNPVNGLITLAKVLSEGKSEIPSLPWGRSRERPSEACLPQAGLLNVPLYNFLGKTISVIFLGIPS